MQGYGAIGAGPAAGRPSCGMHDRRARGLADCTTRPDAGACSGDRAGLAWRPDIPRSRSRTMTSNRRGFLGLAGAAVAGLAGAAPAQERRVAVEAPPAPLDRRLDLLVLAVPGRAAGHGRLHREGRRDGLRRRRDPPRPDGGRVARGRQQDQAPGPLARAGPDGLLDPPGVRLPRRRPPPDQRPEDAVPDRARRQPGHPHDADQHRPMGHDQVVRRLHGQEGDRARHRGPHRGRGLRLGDRRDREAPAPGRGLRGGPRPGEPLGAGPDRRRRPAGSSRRSSRPGSR